jgi:hypothetical protein
MPTPTYDLLYSNVLTGNTTNVSISGFSSAYSDLILVLDGVAATGGGSSDFYPRLQFNSDTGSNYAWQSLQGNGTTASANSGLNETGLQIANGAFFTTGTTGRGQYIAQIFQYANSTIKKSVLSRAIRANLATEILSSNWNNLAAITSILLYSSNGTQMASGTTIYLYGIV